MYQDRENSLRTWVDAVSLSLLGIAEVAGARCADIGEKDVIPVVSACQRVLRPQIVIFMLTGLAPVAARSTSPLVPW